MAILVEGLKEGDLEDFVLPMISIDEYESKLDDDSIVVAFFVQDKDPANDLNRFIQKGAVDILDTDVSPAPNGDGFFMVFVEMLRDSDFPNKLVDTLESIEGLTKIKEWKAEIYNQDGVQIIDPENLASLVRLQSQADDEAQEVDPVEENLTEFFRDSDLQGLMVEGRKVTLEGLVRTMDLQYVDLGDFDRVVENNAVLTQGLRLDETAQHNVSSLKALLGDMWTVEHVQDHVLLSNILSEDVALFRI